MTYRKRSKTCIHTLILDTGWVILATDYIIQDTDYAIRDPDLLMDAGLSNYSVSLDWPKRKNVSNPSTACWRKRRRNRRLMTERTIPSSSVSSCNSTVYFRKTAARQKMGAPDGADIVEWVKGETLLATISHWAPRSVAGVTVFLKQIKIHGIFKGFRMLTIYKKSR